MMDSSRTESFLPIIRQYLPTENLNLPVSLVLAMIDQESGGDPWRPRTEFGWLNRPSQQIFALTERYLRATSWGLLQVLGQTYCELCPRYQEVPVVLKLVLPDYGILWGLRVLRSKLQASGNDLHKAVLLYNGGGRPAYLDEVLDKQARYTAYDKKSG